MASWFGPQNAPSPAASRPHKAPPWQLHKRQRTHAMTCSLPIIQTICSTISKRNVFAKECLLLRHMWQTHFKTLQDSEYIQVHLVRPSFQTPNLSEIQRQLDSNHVASLWSAPTTRCAAWGATSTSGYFVSGLGSSIATVFPVNKWLQSSGPLTAPGTFGTRIASLAQEPTVLYKVQSKIGHSAQLNWHLTCALQGLGFFIVCKKRAVWIGLAVHLHFSCTYAGDTVRERSNKRLLTCLTPFWPFFKHHVVDCLYIFQPLNKLKSAC